MNDVQLLEKIKEASVASPSLPYQSDYFAITSYSGSNPLQIVYKKGGANGEICATVNLTYDGSGNLLTYTLLK